jgi:hypothetical protein
MIYIFNKWISQSCWWNSKNAFVKPAVAYRFPLWFSRYFGWNQFRVTTVAQTLDGLNSWRTVIWSFTRPKALCPLEYLCAVLQRIFFPLFCRFLGVLRSPFGHRLPYNSSLRVIMFYSSSLSHCYDNSIPSIHLYVSIVFSFCRPSPLNIITPVFPSYRCFFPCGLVYDGRRI